MDISTNSSNYPSKVQGVGLENSLRIKLNKDLEDEDVHYRVFISEVGTTVSKVISDDKYRFIIWKLIINIFKVFIDIVPTNENEHFFHLHGIHYVQVLNFVFNNNNENNPIIHNFLTVSRIISMLRFTSTLGIRKI